MERVAPLEAKVKILFIANGGKIGGGNRSLVTLCQSLAKKNVESLVLVPEQGDFAQELAAQKIPFIVRATHLYTLSKPKLLWQLLKVFFLLKKYQPDVIHANDIHCYKFYGRIARLLKIPSVCHMRHFVEGDNADFLIDVLPDYILYNSEYNLIKTEQGLGERPLKKVPRDVAYNFFYQEEYFKPELRTPQREALSLGVDDIAITVVGNINPGKGHLNFIHGINCLVEQLPVALKDKLKVIIVGSDVTNSGLEEQCKALVKSLDLGDLIQFTGFMADAASVYAATDILVIPSEEEPFGRIAVEGVLACKQVIAMNNSGLKEILSPLQTPILCKTACQKDLASALERVITHGVQDDLLRQDQHSIKTLFSEENQLTKLLGIYDKVMRT
jgi:glycosyltransferase involved in cell wall biosynthesis